MLPLNFLRTTTMAAVWYFDVISPFAYLQLQRLGEIAALTELHVVPVALGVILNHCGQLGPAEIPKKRDFAYRFIDFHARSLGFPIRFPPTHPFNPLPALRLISALPEAEKLAATQQVFAHIWRDGLAGDSAATLLPLAAKFGIDDLAPLLGQDSTKLALKQQTESAIRAGVFGVPTLVIGDELFWGFDATDYAIAYLKDPTILSSLEAQRLRALPASVERKRGA
jgi:2-hydroxychromene-2-carboxylate isomerase